MAWPILRATIDQVVARMDARHLDELIELEDRYWWHVAKRNLVCSILKREFPPPGFLLEGGIGSARNLIEFREMGYDVGGYDFMQASVDHARNRGLEDVRQLDLEQRWPHQDQGCRAVILLDVLEHLANPVAALREAKRVLRPDGGVIFTVPAYPWLYGIWDKQLGHYRRYTTRMLRKQASEAGLKVSWVTHWNSFTLPVAVALRTWEKVFPRREAPEFPRVSPMTNRLLLSAAGMERAWLTRFSVPAGLSLVGVLRK